jgi:ABC-type oligopeptide transport system substrate-binding subunit
VSRESFSDQSLPKKRFNGSPDQMLKPPILHTAAVTLFVFVTSLASSQTLRYANQGDLKSLDPYTLNETTTLAHLGHVYEGLIGKGKNLEIMPALAESWQTPEPTRWRFHLRKNVKFHNGDDFTADDVIFSADRVRATGSNLQTRLNKDVKVVKVDNYTVDFILLSPDPIILSQWNTWYIMDKKWARGEQCRCSHAGVRHFAKLRYAQRKRDWCLSHRKSSARCTHRIQSESELVAKASA